MATGSERAWLLPQTDGCLEIRLESGLKWLLPAGTSNRSSLLSGLLEEGSVHEVWVPEGMVDAWLALLSLDATSKRALSSEHLLLYTQAADFFDDRRGLLEATEEIAARLFLPEPAVTQLIGQTSVSIPHQQERNALSQRLETLPAHLVEFVFRLSNATLSQKLAAAPEAVYKQAVLSSFPGVTSDRKLVLEGSTEGRWLPVHSYLRLFRAVGACNKLTELNIDCWFLKTAFFEHAALESLALCISSLNRLKVLKLKRFFYAVPDLTSPAPRLLLAAVGTLYSSLRTLEIEHANYTEAYIAGALLALTGLKHLSLRYSKWGVGGAVAHPDTPIAIAHLAHLTHLDLHWCALPAIRRSSSASPRAAILTEDHERNVFGLRNLTSLQHLELCGCKLSRAPLGAVAETLAMLPALTHLNLSCNALSTHKVGQLFTVPRRNLVALLVDENEFSFDSFLAAAPILPGLQQLSMSKLAVNSMHATESLSKLVRMRNLDALTLPVGALLPDGGLVPSISTVLRALTRLTSLEPEGPLDDMMLIAIAPAIERLIALQSLSLDASNYLLDEEAMHHRETARTYHPLQQALTGASRLRNLTFAAGQWTFTMQQSLDAFIAAISQQPHLTHIHLRFTHQFATRSAYKVVEGLEHVPNLQHLRVYAAGMGVADVEPFIAAVQNLTNLQVLDLGNALDCTYYAGTTLAGMSKLQKLRLLDVSDCKVGSAFGANLARCLENIRTLERVDISGNELSYSGAHALAKMMQDQAQVEVLDIAGSSHLYQTEYIQLTENFPFINW